MKTFLRIIGILSLVGSIMTLLTSAGNKESLIFSGILLLVFCTSFGFAMIDDALLCFRDSIVENMRK